MVGSAISYSRVSTQEQQNNGISLQEQKSTNLQYANNNSMNIIDNIEDICSGAKVTNLLACYNKYKNMNMNIIIADITRFSRHFEKGKKYMEEFIKSGYKIHFIKEHIIVDTIDSPTYNIFIGGLYKSAEEINVLKLRVKKIKKYQKKNGYFMGGRLPYGLELFVDVNDRKKYKLNERENNIRNFVKLCKTDNIGNNILNNQLELILGQKINYFPESNNVSKKRKRPATKMTNKLISNILNKYNIKYRNDKNFTSSIISSMNIKTNINEYINHSHEDMLYLITNSINKLSIYDNIADNVDIVDNEDVYMSESDDEEIRPRKSARLQNKPYINMVDYSSDYEDMSITYDSDAIDSSDIIVEQPQINQAPNLDFSHIQFEQFKMFLEFQKYMDEQKK